MSAVALSSDPAVQTTGLLDATPETYQRAGGATV
jgi:hypothetical protein